MREELQFLLLIVTVTRAITTQIKVPRGTLRTVSHFKILEFNGTGQNARKCNSSESLTDRLEKQTEYKRNSLSLWLIESIHRIRARRVVLKSARRKSSTSGPFDGQIESPINEYVQVPA